MTQILTSIQLILWLLSRYFNRLLSSFTFYPLPAFICTFFYRTIIWILLLHWLFHRIISFLFLYFSTTTHSINNHMKVKKFDSNKLYCSEILSVLLQADVSNQIRMCNLQGTYARAYIRVCVHVHIFVFFFYSRITF